MKEVFLTFALDIMLISKGHRSLKHHEAVVCQAANKALYAHELGSPLHDL